MSYNFLEERRSADISRKTKSKNAALDYLTVKLDRYLSKTPNSGMLLGAEWKYRDHWGSEYSRGYSIKISAFARVIHIHCQGGKIHRAHLIHKLMEEDDPNFPTNKKTRTPKLSYQQGEFNPSRADKLVAAAGENAEGTPRLNMGAVRRELKHSTKPAIDRLLEAKENISDRYEAIIFDGNQHNFKYRYYNEGKKVLSHKLLNRIMKVVNHTQPNAITGAVNEKI